MRSLALEPSKVRPPVDKQHVGNLREYSIWLFGDEKTLPIVRDSRQVDKFARVLASEEALDYLRAVPRPSLDQAYIISGGNQQELYELISTASYRLQEALSSIHLYKDDATLIKMVQRLLENADQIKKTLGIP